MTVGRLSELQDLALAGKTPGWELTEEEKQAWEKIRKRMAAYEQQIKKILQGGKENGCYGV